jgi:hypothetical protein
MLQSNTNAGADKVTKRISAKEPLPKKKEKSVPVFFLKKKTLADG